jgi:MYXO-CTERM domain-containing protein
LFSINPASGSAALLGTLAFSGNSTSLTTVVPAPGALAILGMGGLVALRRRR